MTFRITENIFDALLCTERAYKSADSNSSPVLGVMSGYIWRTSSSSSCKMFPTHLQDAGDRTGRGGLADLCS